LRNHGNMRNWIGVGAAVRVDIRFGSEVNGSSNSFSISSNINNRKCKELVSLGVDMSGWEDKRKGSATQ